MDQVCGGGHKELMIQHLSINITLSCSFEGFIASYYFRNLAPLFLEEQR